jgi:sporulation protein YlmC with PRC-barrel domain
MLRTLVFSAALFAAAGSFAFAQDATSTSHTAAADSSSLAGSHWLASDVYKASVYDPKQNKIGDIDDLVINKDDGTISKAVIGVGGFLGVGQKDVAIPFNELKVASNSDKTWLVLDESKSQLKAAPAYDKDAETK